MSCVVRVQSAAYSESGRSWTVDGDMMALADASAAS